MDKIYAQSPHFRSTRLVSLFSDFVELQRTNSEGFSANIDAWRAVITQFLTQSSTLCWKYDDLVDAMAYTVDGKTYRPRGLYLALESMITKDHSVVPVSEYMKASLETDHTRQANSGAMQSLLGLVWPTKYSNRLASFSAKASGEEEYMLLDKLVKYSNVIEGLALKANDPVDKRQLYLEVCEKTEMTKMDFEKCLVYLTRDMGKFQEIGKDVIILLPQDAYVEPVISTQMTEDLNMMASLKFIIYRLTNHCKEKHRELDDLREEIKEDLKQDHKVSARAKQRRSKLMKAQLEDTIGKLEQLNILKLKMEQAENNRLVLNAFETNSKVLKRLNSQATDVESIIVDLMDEIDKTEETSSVLAGSLQDATTVDDDAINAELEEIENDINKERVLERNREHSVTDIDELNSKLESLNIPQHDPVEPSVSHERVPMAN